MHPSIFTVLLPISPHTIAPFCSSSTSVLSVKYFAVTPMVTLADCVKWMSDDWMLTCSVDSSAGSNVTDLRVTLPPLALMMLCVSVSPFSTANVIRSMVTVAPDVLKRPFGADERDFTLSVDDDDGVSETLPLLPKEVGDVSAT